MLNCSLFFFLGNIFLLPISISLACYVAIYVDLIRMQRRFNRAFKRHLHIRKNLITQILFLFLNFAVFWLPAEIIILYTKNPVIKDTAQVIKCLNILLDPLIITGFDTRFSSAGQQLLSTWPFDQLTRCLNNDRQRSSLPVVPPTTIRRRSIPTNRTVHQQMTPASTWNIANNDDITLVETASDHPLQNRRIRITTNSNRRPRRRKARQKQTKKVQNHV